MIILTEPQARLVPLLERQCTTAEITARLGVSRQRVSALLGELAELGLLRHLGELPGRAAGTTKPTSEWIDGTALAWPMLGWDVDLVRRQMLEQSKAGMVVPEVDTRAAWTGHTVRRVDLTLNEHWWVVQGLLVPRADDRPWHKAAPVFRSVVISAGEESWSTLGGSSMQRGMIVPMTLVRNAYSDVSLDEQVALTMAVAWVLESRALLDTESLNSSILGGE